MGLLFGCGNQVYLMLEFLLMGFMHGLLSSDFKVYFLIIYFILIKLLFLIRLMFILKF